MEYKLITSSSPQGLTNTINLLMVEGWTPVGSHQVVITHSQNRFSGTTHKDTTHETEYSQTMVYKHKNTIEVDIAYYHPDDNEDEKVYDFEGMVEEFENKLSQLDDSVVVMCSVETN
jgi:hypothetical protein